jgi:hypothetical protein
VSRRGPDRITRTLAETAADRLGEQPELGKRPSTTIANGIARDVIDHGVRVV